MTYASTRMDGLLEADFRIGTVVSRSIGIFFNNIVAFTLLASLVAVPGIPNYLIEEQADPPLRDGIILMASGVLMLILWPLLSAIILYATFQHMRGRPVRVMEAATRVLPRALPLLGVMFLSLLGWIVGLVLLVVPGIYLMVIWYVADAACVAEKLGVRQSLTRSRELTKGYRWRVFALLFLIILASLIGSGLVTAAQLAGMNVWGQIAIDIAWQGLSGGFSFVLVAVSYYYLRVAKEGVDVEQIAAVFD